MFHIINGMEDELYQATGPKKKKSFSTSHYGYETDETRKWKNILDGEEFFF